MQLILASTSPFRKSVLEKLGLPFDCHAPEVDEAPQPHETPAQLVERLSIAKAQAVAAHLQQGLVIGSDQVAVIDDEILGKPGNHENAVGQLERAFGKTVTFLTGLALVNAESGAIQAEVVPFEAIKQGNPQTFRFKTTCTIVRLLRVEIVGDLRLGELPENHLEGHDLGLDSTAFGIHQRQTRQERNGLTGGAF